MTRGWEMRALVLAAALGCAGPALAQRNGDVSNGLNNQPTSGEVRSREQAAGVAPPPQAQQAQTGAVDDIYKNLMGKERRDGQTTAPADPNAPMGSSQPR